MRFCAVQFFSVVGNLSVNLDRIEAWVKQATLLSCDAVMFPECALTGYLPQDELFQPSFVDDHRKALSCVARLSTTIDVVIGSIDDAPLRTHQRFFNAYHHFSAGKHVSSVIKTRLPNDDVFCESRFFVPNPDASSSNVLQVKSVQIGVGICEDMWGGTGIFERTTQCPAVKLLVCPSASPYFSGKPVIRKTQMRAIVKTLGIPFLYLNQVGSFDGVMLDGCSYLIGTSQKIWAQLPAFEEQGLVIDFGVAGLVTPEKLFFTTLEKTPDPCKIHKPRKNRKKRIETLSKGLEFGTRNFVLGTGLKKAVVCVSGGIDSALALVLLKRAIGPRQCFGLVLPSPYNKNQATLDAVSLCRAHGVSFRLIPILRWMRCFDALVVQNFGAHAKPVLFENIQARIRGIIAMMFANQLDGCLIGTSNKSELAFGYATLYGDMCAGLFPIGDLTKTQVYTLATYYSQLGEMFPEGVFQRQPSAELAPGQKDGDMLPPYERLDPVLADVLNQEMVWCNIATMESPELPDASITSDDALLDRVKKALKLSQFKRKQMAPILKVSSRDLSRGRVVNISGGSQGVLEGINCGS